MRHIDALRAIAALLVLWVHVGDAFVHLDGPNALAGAASQEFISSLNIGRIGVVTFFLISGFVIPFSLHPQKPAPVRSFLVQRFFRIFPAYWLSIPLGALTGYWIRGIPFTASDFLVNLTLLQDLFGVPPAEGLYWTLLTELMFYALCAVLASMHSLGKPRVLLVIASTFGAIYALAMLSLWIRHPLVETKLAFDFLNLSIMLCGTLYRQLLIDAGPTSDRLARFGILALLAGYLVVLPAITIPRAGFWGNAQVAYALGLLLFLVGERWVRIRTRLTDWLGAISYSIYLFHPVVFMATLWLLQRQPQGSWWRTQHLAVYLLANLALTLLLAEAVHRWVEQPSIRLGRRCAKALQRRQNREQISSAAT